ncbi:MAG TPA: glycoside hydrolase family 16 protein [Gillisia sp.]|nr:glycoside hydrolase family 16 protein [Gillisia sp.]
MRSIISKIMLVILFISFTACKQDTESKVKEKEEDAWELVWSDEFDYEGLPDPAKWTHDTAGNSWGWGNNEAQFHTSKDSNNSYVSNGSLKINALIKEKEGKKYTSARLITKGKGDWKYGKFEVKAKLPQGRGTWPAIWMLSSDDSVKWPDMGEIDIMEHVGFDPDTVFSTVHTKDYNHMIGTQVGEKMYLPTATEEFHIYSLEWDKDELRSYVDGKQYFTYKNDGTGEGAWPFNKPFFLILNLAIGGGLGGQQGIDDAQFPHTLEVEYVRVFQKNN